MSSAAMLTMNQAFSHEKGFQSDNICTMFFSYQISADDFLEQ